MNDDWVTGKHWPQYRDTSIAALGDRVRAPLLRLLPPLTHPLRDQQSSCRNIRASNIIGRKGANEPRAARAPSRPRTRERGSAHPSIHWQSSKAVRRERRTVVDNHKSTRFSALLSVKLKVTLFKFNSGRVINSVKQHVEFFPLIIKLRRRQSRVQISDHNIISLTINL